MAATAGCPGPSSCTTTLQGHRANLILDLQTIGTIRDEGIIRDSNTNLEIDDIGAWPRLTKRDQCGDIH